MRRGRTFRSGRTPPADGQSNNSETLSRIQSLADYTIDTLESSFRKRQASISLLLLADRTSMCPPIDETAARESVTMESFTSGLFGFAKTANRVASGTN